MHLVGDRFSLARNILARFTAGSNEVSLNLGGGFGLTELQKPEYSVALYLGIAGQINSADTLPHSVGKCWLVRVQLGGLYLTAGLLLP